MLHACNARGLYVSLVEAPKPSEVHPGLHKHGKPTKYEVEAPGEVHPSMKLSLSGFLSDLSDYDTAPHE